MGKASSHKKTKATTVTKGRILEQIVAWMHDQPNVKVERNVRLRAQGKVRRYREIDVLISSNVAGYSVRIAIECKNEEEITGSPKIDAFVGKLHDIGIPLQHGIFVSASGYTSGAISRAEDAGIRPLILAGLNKEALSNEVSHAFQSTVHLSLRVLNFQILFERPVTLDSYNQPNFFDEKGNFCGVVPDIVWQNWMSGSITSDLGKHKLQLQLPKNWVCIVQGEVEEISSIEVNIEISGLVTTFVGTANIYSLKHATTEEVEKQYLEATFSKPSGPLPIESFNTEAELIDFINNRAATFNAVLGRVRLPKIQVGVIRWPISERVATQMLQLKRAHEAGLVPAPELPDIANIEGFDMGSYWDPIWSGYPFFANQHDLE